MTTENDRIVTFYTREEATRARDVLLAFGVAKHAVKITAIRAKGAIAPFLRKGTTKLSQLLLDTLRASPVPMKSSDLELACVGYARASIRSELSRLVRVSHVYKIGKSFYCAEKLANDQESTAAAAAS